MAVSLSAEHKQKHHKQLKGKMCLTASFAKRRERKTNPTELQISLSDKQRISTLLEKETNYPISF